MKKIEIRILFFMFYFSLLRLLVLGQKEISQEELMETSHPKKTFLELIPQWYQLFLI
jgi:hypothetical protein